VVGDGVAVAVVAEIEGAVDVAGAGAGTALCAGAAAEVADDEDVVYLRRLTVTWAALVEEYSVIWRSVPTSTVRENVARLAGLGAAFLHAAVAVVPPHTVTCVGLEARDTVTWNVACATFCGSAPTCTVTARSAPTHCDDDQPCAWPLDHDPATAVDTVRVTRPTAPANVAARTRRVRFGRAGRAACRPNGMYFMVSPPQTVPSGDVIW